MPDSAPRGRLAALAPVLLSVFLLAALAGGCSTIGYYAQSISGHLEIMGRRQPVAALIASPQTSATLKQRLQTVNEILRYAHAQLQLPDNGSYTHYAQLDRHHAVWTVYAAPEFSMQPLQWCFPVIGCLAYRGYFKPDAAKSFAQQLKRKGNDTYVAGATAYSTLGWFKDPVVSPMLRWPDPTLALVIFHELAHQLIYVPSDAEFNEAFATAVAREGVRRWLGSDNNKIQAFEVQLAMQSAFVELVRHTREQLSTLYATSSAPKILRVRKQAVWAEMRADYAEIKTRFAQRTDYDDWMNQPLNNAQLNAVATYHRLVPVFEKLLRDTGKNLPEFYRRVQALGKLPIEQRHRLLAGPG